MTALLRELPYWDRSSRMRVGGASVPIPVKAHQIVVWVSVAPADAPALEPGAPRFPAILDTGSTFTFSLRQAHLQGWAGIHPNYLRLLGSIRHLGKYIPNRAAHVWLHGNRPGERDVFTGRPPYRLKLKRGIAIYPSDMPQAPRLPLLGLMALEENRLHLKVDTEHRRVTLRTPDLVTWLWKRLS